MADLQSSTTSLRHLTADGNHSVNAVDSGSHSTMASRLSTDSLDSEGQVTVARWPLQYASSAVMSLTVKLLIEAPGFY